MTNKRVVRFIVFGLIGLAALYLLLMIPESRLAAKTSGGQHPFVWNQDQVWANLEKRFTATRQSGCDSIAVEIGLDISSLESLLSSATWRFRQLEERIFELTPLVAACPDYQSRFINLIHETRKAAKRQSVALDGRGELKRDELYRLLYGTRIAEEEILLQSTVLEGDALVKYDPVFAQGPFAQVHGVRIHSGDILLSRGGAPTSALIARGNDFPGNFSHVALVHVDEETRTPSIIEAHIEKGVAIASVEQYLADTKLRILVLRLRPDLPAIERDRLIAHKAASDALARAKREHIPYDFAMDVGDPSSLFCSEVASSVYRKFGVELWQNTSTLSSPGLVNWLTAFGVRHFQTEAPSDLEYDPKLALVAEWRDPKNLLKEHVDNAAVDAMLELAESGRELEYNPWLLPLARLMKLWSFVLNLTGRIGPIPEGMSATAALKNKWYSAWHGRTCQKTYKRVEAFKLRHGYVPPYWQLVAFARDSLRD